MLPIRIFGKPHISHRQYLSLAKTILSFANNYIAFKQVLACERLSCNVDIASYYSTQVLTTKWVLPNPHRIKKIGFAYLYPISNLNRWI